jgi:hypothetical protein
MNIGSVYIVKKNIIRNKKRRTLLTKGQKINGKEGGQSSKRIKGANPPRRILKKQPPTILKNPQKGIR